MSVIESTTGHSRRKEKSIARILYIALITAVVFGIGFAIIAGRSNNSLDPYKSDAPAQAAPDVGAPPPAAPAQ